jgi:hypothetical protein
MSDNGTYNLCKINVVPSGGEWADEQESVDNPYKMLVKWDTTIMGFTDFGEGWVYAVDQSQPVTITLLDDWVAPNGKFEYSKGTDSGRLHISGGDDITIDLNGNDINRNLSTATSNGQVFRLASGAKLTITDNSDSGDGKITGGYNSGDGGAFYVDYGKLYVKGGNITGNKAQRGGAIYCDDLDDAFVYVEGGKVTDNTATENGGGIYMYNGFLYVEGGEITGNYADKGAGIYWYSDNNLCITGGKITGNTARKIGGGIYHEGGGSFGGNADNVYFGGNLQICGNSANGYENNVYIKALRAVNRTAGQTEEIPNVPLVDGASIGISMDDTEGTSLVSGPDSRFDSNNFGYFFGDNSNYFVRAVFDERIANSPHRLFYNKWSYKDAVYPKIKTVTPRENNGLISEASIDTDKQIITLKAISSDKSLFKSVVVESLVSFITSNDADVYWRFCDVAFDLSKPVEYKVVSKSTGTYVHCRVVVEFPDCLHNDKDGDCICDECGEYAFTDTAIGGYNAQKATVFITEAGRYSLIFSDYENNRLANMDIVEYDFKEGINVIPQEITSFTLASGDKVMLWYDMVNLAPVCDELTVK